MKQISGIFILIGFTALSVFGFALMHHGSDGHGMCPASMAQGGACANDANPFASAIFHLDGFRSFSTLVLVALLSFAAIVAFLWLAPPSDSIRRFSFAGTVKETKFLSERTFLHWLSIHENSPNFS